MVIIMKYDLIALDMDGTLLNDDKVIPQENVDAIIEMQEQGKNRCYLYRQTCKWCVAIC